MTMPVRRSSKILVVKGTRWGLVFVCCGERRSDGIPGKKEGEAAVVEQPIAPQSVRTRLGTRQYA